jgi:hypothetical protein
MSHSIVLWKCFVSHLNSGNRSTKQYYKCGPEYSLAIDALMNLYAYDHVCESVQAYTNLCLCFMFLVHYLCKVMKL